MSDIKQLLASDTAKSIEVLKVLFSEKDNDLYNSIILQSGRYNSLQKKVNNDTIEPRDAEREENRIRLALTDLIDKYQRDYGQIVVPAGLAGVAVTPPTNGNAAPTVTGSNIMDILFLAANPKNEARLQVDVEFRKIEERLQMATHRNDFKLSNPKLAVTIEGLIQSFSQVRPEIVHFSGHGTEQGIYITDEQNNALLMPTNALKRLFNQYKEIVKAVVLSACYSEAQAKVVSELGIYVAGMNNAVSDDAAIVFSTGFYLGLGEKQSVETAFDSALIALETKFPNELNLPVLWKDGQQIAGGKI
ncbi:MAG: CHAT domain-containing protein [Saprospiraceae bacterium]